MNTAYPRIGTSCAHCGESILVDENSTEIGWYHLKTGLKECTDSSAGMIAIDEAIEIVNSYGDSIGNPGANIIAALTARKVEGTNG